MSKDNRNIVRAPRIHGRMVTDEDEIEQLLSPAQGEKLLESGALTGDWEFEGDGEEETPHVSPLDVLTDENQRLKARTEGYKEDFDRLSTIHDNNVRDLKTAKTEIERLKSQLQDAGDNSQAALRNSQTEIDALKDEVSALESESVRLQAQVETLKLDADKAKAPPKK